MSKFADKAKEVYDEGVAERGNFEPTGGPLAVYKYWYKNTNNKPERENFCHFWRVVAIWAPLMWLRNKAETFLDSRAGKVTLLVIAVLAFIGIANSALTFGQFLFFGVFLPWLIVSLIAGILLAVTVESENVNRNGRWLLTGLTPSWVTYGIARYFQSLTEDDWDKADIFFNKYGPGVAATVIVGGLVALGFVHWWVPLVALGCIAGFAGLVALLVVTGDFIKGRRAKAKRERKEYEKTFYAENGYHTWERPPGTPPNKVDVFFSKVWDKVKAGATVVADFVILLAQVVRVNKWKICPTVDIPMPEKPTYTYDETRDIGW